jgi:type II secretory pathway component PulK
MSTTERSRRGFALPMAMLVMVVLTAGIAAGYAATSAEVVSNAAHRGDTRAYNLAVAGLEQFLARGTKMASARTV